MLPLPGHAIFPFGSGRAKLRKSKYSFDGNQPGCCPQALTTVWRTELGTTLQNGFNSTTVLSAYFRCLRSPSLQRAADSRQVPLPYGPAYRALGFKANDRPRYDNQMR